MSGLNGRQNRWGTGENSRPNRKRKPNLQREEEKRQRARDGFNMLQKLQDVKNRGPPAFPHVGELQLHRVQPGMVRLDTYMDGFDVEDTTGQVNWIGAVSHDHNPTWGSRVAVNNADALAALCTTIQAIGARENAPIVRLALIFEPDTKETGHKDAVSTVRAGKAWNSEGPSGNPAGFAAPGVKLEPADNTGIFGNRFKAPPLPNPYEPRDGNTAFEMGKGNGPARGPPASITSERAPSLAYSTQHPAVAPEARAFAAVEPTSCIVVCANCRHQGHEAKFCPKPDSTSGSMFTCMICNDIGHLLDDCPDFLLNKEFAKGVSMGNLSKEMVLTAIKTLHLRATRPAVRSEKFFYLDWLHLAQHHGLLTRFLDKPAKGYLPWTDSFSLKLASDPHNQWENCIKIDPTNPKEWTKNILLPYDPAWEGLTLGQVLDRHAKGQLKHLRFVSLNSKERILCKAGEEVTEFALRQLVQWGLVWPPKSGEMAGFVVLPSEILEAQKSCTIVPVKREQDDDGMEPDNIPATTTGGVVVAGSGYMSQTITTLNHGDGETWGIGPFLRDEMRPRWNFLAGRVQKGIIKYRQGWIQHPHQYDRNDEFETYLMKLLEQRIKRDATGAKAPVELPRNLLATLNAEVVEADIDAMIRNAGLPHDRS